MNRRLVLPVAAAGLLVWAAYARLCRQIRVACRLALTAAILIIGALG